MKLVLFLILTVALALNGKAVEESGQYEKNLINKENAVTKRKDSDAATKTGTSDSCAGCEGVCKKGGCFKWSDGPNSPCAKRAKQEVGSDKIPKCIKCKPEYPRDPKTGKCGPRKVVCKRKIIDCKTKDGKPGIKYTENQEVCLETDTQSADEEESVGQVSTTTNKDPEEFRVDCAFNTLYRAAPEDAGNAECNYIINTEVLGIPQHALRWVPLQDYRCFKGHTGRYHPGSTVPVGFNDDTTAGSGHCDCAIPYVMATDGTCKEFTCSAGGSGAECKTCVEPALRTRNNQCASCNDGYLVSEEGDCLEISCTENPDNWTWKGCQECRPTESMRHQEDCLYCAHGYRFLHEQSNLPNATIGEPQYSQGKMQIPFKETGYCYPYTCIAGGDIENAQPGESGPYSLKQRQVKITAIISTENGKEAEGVPKLDADVLEFRDHCRTCVPQQLREKNDHCETCNPGYYLDEMHHTCRKKTCGVPHFRRNSVGCDVLENLHPRPNSTPCLDCMDDSDECCVERPPVLTCGAQNVFCQAGTQKANYHTISCEKSNCVHYSEDCCDPKTCKNQQVGCSKDQLYKKGDTECDDCKDMGTECCTDKASTCGIEKVKCGPSADGILQRNLPANTPCEVCQHDGLECCLPRQTTCQNQGVVCHAGTHLAREGADPVPCEDCENYGEECCAATTCLNQRVSCPANREHRGKVECVDCIDGSDECCKPPPPIPPTCGNQLVKCEPRLYRPHATPCTVGEKGTCKDYADTCCVPKTCGNQEVGCNTIQTARAADTACTNCNDGGDECCMNARTCGLLGVKCLLGGYRHVDTPCGECENYDEDECCENVPKTCTNQGVICLPGTHRAINTVCENCDHYGSDCCVKKTCGNQQVACSRGRARKGDVVECTSCVHDSDDCCEAEVRTCAAMSVKCHDGYYEANQDSLDCKDNCENYAEPCCVPFVKTCGNQDVVCNDEQTYLAVDKTCTDCVNNGGECCKDIVKTCANQNVVCRPDQYVKDLSVACGDCRNDAKPCCVPYVRTCGNQDVVCSAQQTYKLPTTVCTTCENQSSQCCVDIKPTCSNQRVQCRPGHYAADYSTKECVGCLNDDVNECCVALKLTCGNQNVQCGKDHSPKEPQTVCSDCTHDSKDCCDYVPPTCGNQAVVCRPDHYVTGYKTQACPKEGCVHDAAPCCDDFEPTCGTENVKCGAMQTYKGHNIKCGSDGCKNRGSICCADVTHTCKNQGTICRPGQYAKDQGSIACGEGGCKHHSAPCCTLYVRTCGNQDAMCTAGQTYKQPDTACTKEDGCTNGGSDCCVDIAKTCKNQQVTCRPGHYVTDRDTKCGANCNNDAKPCCVDFKTTCGNQNVQCGKDLKGVDHVPVADPRTECDGAECKNNSAKCCVPVDATCRNQDVVCRPGHYVEDYGTASCSEQGCLNDAAPCCKPYVKTCANQNVRCGAGLTKHIADSDIECKNCVNYGKECCDVVKRTCGNSGQECRQDLYLPASTECTTCDTTQCCKPIPPAVPTCANQKHVCPSAHYKPGAIACEATFDAETNSYTGIKCSDKQCCHSFPVTCGNQNVQCHEETYRNKDTPCTNCKHYDEECCTPRTCRIAEVKCDERYYFEQEKDYNTITCTNCQDNTPPCCVYRPQGATPTCGDKFAVLGTCMDDSDEKQSDLVKNWPFLAHLAAITPVSCDASKGYYKRLGASCNTCGVTAKKHTGKNNWSACQDNDTECCWRKTCKPNDNLNNGFANGGEGILEDEFDPVVCPAKHKMKDNAEYIVCNGDCIADCCERIPDPDTCQSARVACSHGFERRKGWSKAECGDECVENSAVCCQRTTCRNVNCPKTHELLADKECFECQDGDEECCREIPIADTCKNQRVHCGYGHFKRSDWETHECKDCIDDGECCVPKTCGARGVEDAVRCTKGKMTPKALTTTCFTCVDDGAECCDPVPPKRTCRNEDVNCGFGFSHQDPDKDCVLCLDNGVGENECCVQNTCAGVECSAGKGLKTKSPGTTCTLCLDHEEECCTKLDTCWTAEIVCPSGDYPAHPNTVCESLDGGCSVDTCCEAKTCDNQGVCCNENLGFTAKGDLSEIKCEGCADNCEECCAFKSPTCSTAKVGCGFGYARKAGADDVVCETCALNDLKCCDVKTCDAKVCDPKTHVFLGDHVRCHFCEKDECCKPIEPTPTCRSENINCGAGFARVADSEDTACTTCVQNDSACCREKKCSTDASCPKDDLFKNKGDVLCITCREEECCDETPSCEGENVGCGIGMKPIGNGKQQCSTCALNDLKCCAQKTCGSEGHVCPDGFTSVVDQGKKCAFCETSECCVPVEPTKTCGNQAVGCAHGLTKIPNSEETACGMCELNSKLCCSQNTCAADMCPTGMQRKSTVTECGFCSVEECCEIVEPTPTCVNQQVGCGFGMKMVGKYDENTCSTCAHNDLNCCEPKTCGADGPVCGDVLGELDLPYTEKGALMECSDCDLKQCCVPPVVQQTCQNQNVVCSAHFDAKDPSTTCESCLNNGDECCTARTCANQEVSCDSLLYETQDDYDSSTCIVCADNALECCEPKHCGKHFDDVCDASTHTTNPKNTPCVDCDVTDCCTVLPTLKCTEIIIPNGQAFYSRPAGDGSERTKGSILTVECDLGFKFQDAEYEPSPDPNTRDQDVTVVDYPVCNPILMQKLIDGHVETFSPTTSGWNRAPPVCRPVTCPVLEVESILTPDAVTKFDIGSVIYRDAQMDTVPKRGAGYGPRDYAGEADVVCNEGWIRVANVCSEEVGADGDEVVENTLEYELKGYWKLDGDLLDSSPHCVKTRGTQKQDLGSCNDGELQGDGSSEFVDATVGQGLHLTRQFVQVSDDWNPNWRHNRKGKENELNIDGRRWTASIIVNLDEDSTENDAFFFVRYTVDYDEIVKIYMDGEYLEVSYNGKRGFGPDDKMVYGRPVSIIARMDGENLEIWLDGVMAQSKRTTAKIQDTKSGHILLGADKEPSGEVNGLVDGTLDEARYYTRAITDEEIVCLSQGKTTCGVGKYYAKPYNTQGCNRESEEIKSVEECRQAINELLQDSILGNSLNGGNRFGREIQDQQGKVSYEDVPSACSYREEDAQIIFNPNPSGRAHTSLAPICRTNPSGKDLQEIGCLPKCLANGKWSVALPTCEKDWCNPIFEEWSCCRKRVDKMDQTYWLKHHDQKSENVACPIGYGDCDHDRECLVDEEKNIYGLCSQRRDLDNIDVCVTDLDPCGDVLGATGTLCVVMTAVGMDYRSHANAGLGHNLFFGGLIVAFGSAAGYYMMTREKGEEHRALLDEI